MSKVLGRNNYSPRLFFTFWDSLLTKVVSMLSRAQFRSDDLSRQGKERLPLGGLRLKSLLHLTFVIY